MIIQQDISGWDVRIPNPLNQCGDRLCSHLFARLVNRSEWDRQEARVFQVVDSAQTDLLRHGNFEHTQRRFAAVKSFAQIIPSGLDGSSTTTAVLAYLAPWVIFPLGTKCV